MRKLITLLALVAMMSVLLVACGDNGTTEAATDATVTEAEATEAADDATEADTDAAADEDTEAADAAGEGLTGPITVVSREDGSGTRGAFVEIVGVEDENGNDMTVGSAIIGNGTDQVMTTVQGAADAIGYISLGSLNDTVKALQIDGVDATDDLIKEGQYPIARPFNVATKGELSEIAQDFLDFVMSAEGQAIASDGYISVDDNAAAYEAKEGLSGNIQVGGSTSVAPLMEKMAEEYMTLNPDVTIDIQSTGSTAGMTGAIDGTLEIGMASRELTDEENAELDGLVIANDGIAVIVNNDNPLTDISLENVKGIFLGEIVNWEDVQ